MESQLLAFLIAKAGQVPSLQHAIDQISAWVVLLWMGITSLMAAWSALVKMLRSLAKLQEIYPKAAALGKLADALSVEEAKVYDFEQSKILPIVNRLSSAPIPKLPALEDEPVAKEAPPAQ
jgi:hypothetical protein